jgi:hypothetical protein
MKTIKLTSLCLTGGVILSGSCRSVADDQGSEVTAKYEYCNAAEDNTERLESYKNGDTYELVDIKFDFGRLPFQPVCIAPIDFQLGDIAQVAVQDEKNASVQHQGRNLAVKNACIGTNWDMSKRQVEYTGTVDLAQIELATDKLFSGEAQIYGEVAHPAPDTLIINEHWEYRARSKCSHGLFGTGGECFKVLRRYNIAMNWPVGKMVDFDKLETFGENEDYRWLKSIKDEGACYSKYQLTYKKI